MPVELFTPNYVQVNNPTITDKTIRIDQRKRTDENGRFNREAVGSKAFNLDYLYHTSDQEMRDDIVSYLGEYRFQLKKHNYEMVYARGTDGKFAMRDTARGESLKVKAGRILAEKRFNKEPTHREEHEERGIDALDTQLRFAQHGDKIRWMSPPGPKNEGYGTYGFLYEGTVDKSQGEVSLHMSAIRVEGGDLAAYNGAFSELTSTQVDHHNAGLFLEDPRLVRGKTAQTDTEAVLKKYFDFSFDAAQNRDFQRLIGRLDPLIYEVIDKIKYGSAREKVTAFNTLENYFLKHKKMMEEEWASGGKLVHMDLYRDQGLDELSKDFGFAPPVAAGSCGSTEQSSSLSITGNRELDRIISNQSEHYDFDHTGNCRVCGKEEVQVGPCNICEPCDSRIKASQVAQEYVQKMYPLRVKLTAA